MLEVLLFRRKRPETIKIGLCWAGAIEAPMLVVIRRWRSTPETTMIGLFGAALGPLTPVSGRYLGTVRRRFGCGSGGSGSCAHCRAFLASVHDGGVSRGRAEALCRLQFACVDPCVCLCAMIVSVYA